MKRHVKFFQVFSIWILLTYDTPVSAKKEPPECEKDSLEKEHPEFSYQYIDAWGIVYPLCKKGKQQSPINMGSKVEVYKVKKFPVEIINYDQKLPDVVVQNNGHGVQLKGHWEKNTPILTGPAFLGETYEFNEIALHWGTAENNGTEHSILGKKYAAELQVVQKNVKYPDLMTALKEKNGVIISALLFQHNKVKPPNKGIQQIAKLASAVSEPGSVAIADLDMSLLEFYSIKSFYTYTGSLTRPPCSENIRWIVSADLLPIDDESLNQLRSVKLTNNDKSNIRPIQKYTKSSKVKLFSKIK